MANLHYFYLDTPKFCIMDPKEIEVYTKQFEDFFRTHECDDCGSHEVTKVPRSKPFSRIALFHKELSKKLGWTTME